MQALQRSKPDEMYELLCAGMLTMEQVDRWYLTHPQDDKLVVAAPYNTAAVSHLSGYVACDYEFYPVQFANDWAWGNGVPAPAPAPGP